MSARVEVVVCRCEEVTLGEVEACVDAGARTLQEVKMMTRAGMGACQGRVCRTLLVRLVQPPPEAPPLGLAVHLPVSPVHLAQVAEEG